MYIKLSIIAIHFTSINKETMDYFHINLMVLLYIKKIILLHLPQQLLKYDCLISLLKLVTFHAWHVVSVKILKREKCFNYLPTDFHLN